jgi:hypothetical protein
MAGEAAAGVLTGKTASENRCGDIVGLTRGDDNRD